MYLRVQETLRHKERREIMVKKILIILSIILVLSILPGFRHDTRLNTSNDTIDAYTPQTQAQRTYPINNYVDEKLNASVFFHDALLYSLVNSESLLTSNNLKEDIKSFFIDSFFDLTNYNKYIQDSQYKENNLIYLEPVDGVDEYNYLYNGYLEDGTLVTGRLALFNFNGNPAIALSFLDENGDVDPNLVKLLADDSNSEYLTYLIMEEIQNELGTLLEPNDAYENYFGNSFEEIAGSIAYHALTTKYIIENGGSEYVLGHTQVVNISKGDDDGVFVNRPL